MSDSNAAMCSQILVKLHTSKFMHSIYAETNDHIFKFVCYEYAKYNEYCCNALILLKCDVIL